MSPILTLKDPAREERLFTTRAIVASVLVAVLLAVLLVRLVQLQVLEFEHFQTLSEDNRVKIVPIAPTRGLIFDRNGVVLAQNLPTYSLDVVPEAVDDIESLVEKVREIIDVSERDEARFKNSLKRTRRFDSVSLRLRLDDTEVARFSVNQHRFPGVEVRARLTRDYPLGELAVHLVGYVGRINERELREIDVANYRASDYIGKTGVEQALEAVLHGSVGYQHVETNAQGRTLRVLERRDPGPGSNVFLTIDASLQQAAEAALGVEHGAVVAIDPATGGVLAFASRPAFDPNLFVDGIDSKTYRALVQSPGRPLFNRVLKGQYPPGSTVKPFVGLAGLEYGIEQASKQVWCPGWFRLPGLEHRYRDWKKHGHGRVDITKSIEQSCDVFYYELALALGIDRMHEFMKDFGFGQRTGIGLRGESSGLLPSRRWKREARNQPWFPGETLIAGIGQGFMLSTPLQLATATATLAARGVRLKPMVVDRTVDPETGEITDSIRRTLKSIEPKRTAHWQTVIDAMVAVVHSPRGTARKISKGMTYRTAGKTGTAQVFTIGQDDEYDETKIAKKLRDHGLFIAFAPVDEPRIAVAIVVENGGSGSKAAAPIARKVMDHYLVPRTDSPDRARPTLQAGIGAQTRPAALAGSPPGDDSDSAQSTSL